MIDGDVWMVEIFVIFYDEVKEFFILGRMFFKEWNYYELYIVYEYE